MGNASKMDRPAKEPEDPVLVGGFRFVGGILLFLFDAGGSPRDSKKAAILALLSRLSTCLMNGVNLTFFAFLPTAFLTLPPFHP